MLALIVISFIALFGCGQKDETVTEPAPAPSGQVPTDAQAEALVAKDCGGCHNGSEAPRLLPAATFKASQAKAELVSGGMPKPPATITAADKAALLAYLNAP